MKKRLIKHFEVLCKKIGSRTYGSREEKECSSYISNSFKDIGLDLKIQQFPVEKRYFAEIELCKIKNTKKEKINCLPFAFSSFTLERGLDLQFEYVESTEEEVLKRKNLKGKAVLLFKGFGGEYKDYKRLIDSGVSAVILIDYRYPVSWPISLGMPYMWKEAGTVPAVSVSYFDGEKLIKERVNRIFIKVKGIIKNEKSENVIGILKGRTSENIIICAHHDSVSMCEGADDNASGVAVVLELARMFSKLKPERNLIFITFGSEEVLSYGAFQFVKNNPEILSKTKIVVNFDAVGSCLGESKIEVTGSGSLIKYLERKTSSLKHYFKIEKKVSPYSDHYPHNIKGISSLWVSRINCLAGYYHYHSYNDNIGFVDLDVIKKTIYSLYVILKELGCCKKLPFSVSIPYSQKKEINKYHQNLCRKWLM